MRYTENRLFLAMALGIIPLGYFGASLNPIISIMGLGVQLLGAGYLFSFILGQKKRVFEILNTPKFWKRK